MNKEHYMRLCFFLIIIIIFLLILFYLFDIKNTDVQEYLNQIYNNDKILKEKFKYYINENYSVIKENQFIFIENILNPEFFDFLKHQFDDLQIDTKETIGRKASGIKFSTLHKSEDYKGLLELFYSNDFLNVLIDVIEKPVQRTPLNDENTCSLLIYNKKGDYINWHKDYSNYNGDRYVVLLTLVNENKDKNGLSENEFYYIHDGEEHKLKMKENSVVIFKGSEIFHKSTAIAENEKRVLLSMVFCDICQEKKNIINYIYEKIKNLVIYNY